VNRSVEAQRRNFTINVVETSALAEHTASQRTGSQFRRVASDGCEPRRPCWRKGIILTVTSIPIKKRKKLGSATWQMFLDNFIFGNAPPSSAAGCFPLSKRTRKGWSVTDHVSLTMRQSQMNNTGRIPRFFVLPAIPFPAMDPLDSRSKEINDGVGRVFRNPRNKRNV